MSLYSIFWTVLGGTVALLGIDLYTGLNGKRIAHLVFVGFTVIGLVLSIVTVLTFVAIVAGCLAAFRYQMWRLERTT